MRLVSAALAFPMTGGQLTAKCDGHVLDFIRGAVPGGGGSVRPAEWHCHSFDIGGLDFVDFSGDYWVVALVSGQNRSCDRLVSRVGRPA